MKEEFLKRMQVYLKDEYDDYLATLSQPAYKGLRINTTKISSEAFQAEHILTLTPSAICKDAFYYDGNEVSSLGNHPAHLSGLFYIQEPSASSAVEVLDVQEGDWVLDLCAAPGGKSTQIATKLNHTGFLVANEIVQKRAMILMSNLERLGFSECMVTNASPNDLEKAFQGSFDRILVDAPCSGEGMFKIHESAMEEWSVEHVQACAKRQRNILESAYQMLKQDGVMVYSTCTYAMEENEETIHHFLSQHHDMELLDCNVSFGRIGFPYKDLDYTKVRRILPMDQGEGHFIAKLCKKGEASKARFNQVNTKKIDDCVQQFIKQQTSHKFPYFYEFKGRIYAKQAPFIQLERISILRQGLLVGEVKKGRIEPHHHFYVSSLLKDTYLQAYEMSEEETKYYLAGNTLMVAGYKGFVALKWHGHVLGFGKGDGTMIKNKYPKGLMVR